MVALLSGSPLRTWPRVEGNNQLDGLAGRLLRAYLLKEDFQGFWEYVSPTWAGKFLDRWCIRTMRSRLEPMQRVAHMLRRHRPLILNWFRAKGAVSAGTV